MRLALIEHDASIPLAPPGEAAAVETAEPRRAELVGWVSAARQGDRRAFARLHSRYARMVHGILLARVPTVEVDYLVQEVFVTAIEKIGDLREDAAFGGWLAAVARRAAADRHRSRRVTESLPDELPARHRDPADAADAARVLASIRELPEAYRETLLLRLAEGLNGPEIAELTGLTPGSVRVNLHRGLALLRERLGRGVTT